MKNSHATAIKVIAIALVALIVALAVYRTINSNAIVKNLGGKDEITLPEGRVLVNCTWRGDNLWILTRDTSTGITYFSERSPLGILEGEITFK
jgi:hypothetical protein